jgi:hypothetical protein
LKATQSPQDGYTGFAFNIVHSALAQRSGAVGNHPLAAGVSRKLRNQRPAALFGGLVEQALKRSLQPQLVYYSLTPQMLEVFEVRLDQRAARLGNGN